MRFTVAHKDGIKTEAEYQAYARLLRQHGIDLARVPRVPESATGRRWLFVWQNDTEAQRFADELNRRTPGQPWYVRNVEEPPSEGPLGPLLIQAARQSDGWAFALHPLSRAMLHSLHERTNGPSTVTIGIENNSQNGHETRIRDLLGQVVPLLTGLKPDQLEPVGYRVLDADTGEELLNVR
jgi:hypothetical protein